MKLSHRNTRTNKPRHQGEKGFVLASNCKVVVITSHQFCFLNVTFLPHCPPCYVGIMKECSHEGPIAVYRLMWSWASQSTSLSSPINGWGEGGEIYTETFFMSEYMKIHITAWLNKYYKTSATVQIVIVHLDYGSYRLPVISLPFKFTTFKTPHWWFCNIWFCPSLA